MNENKINNFLQKGIKLYKKGRFAKAIKVFQKAECIDPNDLRILHVQVVSYSELKDFMKAKEINAKIMLLFPHDFTGYFNEGMIAQLTGDNDRAERYFRMAMIIEPDNPRINFFYGQFLCSTGQYNQALLPLTISAEANYEEQKSIDYLIICHNENGNTTKSQELHRIIQEQYKINEPYNVYLSFLYGSIREWDKVIDYCEKELSNNPCDDNANTLLILAHQAKYKDLPLEKLKDWASTGSKLAREFCRANKVKFS
jgi:Tfp pilus assembly protein PilF